MSMHPGGEIQNHLKQNRHLQGGTKLQRLRRVHEGMGSEVGLRRANHKKPTPRIAGPARYGRRLTANCGLRIAEAASTRMLRTVEAATAPSANDCAPLVSARLSRANVRVTLVEEIMPPSAPAHRYPWRGPRMDRTTKAAKLMPENNKTMAHSSCGRIENGPYGPSGSSGRMTRAIRAKRNPARRPTSGIWAIQECNRDFLHQQDGGDHGDPAGEAPGTKSSDQARGDHDQGGDLGGCIGIALADGCIGDHDDRQPRRLRGVTAKAGI